MTLCVIFPANPLNLCQVDPDYAAEQQAAAQYFDTAVIDFDALVQQGQVHFSGLPAHLGTVLYRGWMLRPEQYPLLYQAVTDQGGQLLTDTKAYMTAHLLPSWAEHPHTPKACWTTDLSDAALIALLNQFTGPVTVKDFVKSRKNEWNLAFYIPSAQAQTAALEVIHNFIERQGDLLVGGVVLREFVPFKPIGYFHDEPTYEEYRVFYWYGQPFSIYNYWTQGETALSPNDEAFIATQANGIASPFFTIDFARLASGELTIMKIGDGQVSGLQGCPAELFYQRLSRVVNTAKWSSICK